MASYSSVQPDDKAASTSAGAAAYSRPGLLKFFYDAWVLGISNSFAWGCPTRTNLLPFFQSRIQARKHLDIGVGTGYYPSHSNLSADTNITLCDLNPDSLRAAASSLQAAVPGISVRTILHDIEQPLTEQENLEEKEKFDSISLVYLLHCMPGPPHRKAAIFAHLKHHLAPDGGLLFGATILNRGVHHNWFGRSLIDWYNRKGIFGNAEDSAEDFLVPLKTHFEDVQAEVKGRVLLFTASKPLGI